MSVLSALLDRTTGLWASYISILTIVGLAVKMSNALIINTDLFIDSSNNFHLCMDLFITDNVPFHLLGP